MTERSAGRRLILSLTGIAIAACLLRAQLADALVMRGDGLLYRGNLTGAMQRYERAVWIDPDDGVAVDRYAFVALSTHRRIEMIDGVRVASAYLRRHASDGTVRMDRAMTYRALGETRRALADFREVGHCCADVRALTFAGYAALALGERKQAASLWRAALALSPNFVAARHGLARLERRS